MTLRRKTYAKREEWVQRGQKYRKPQCGHSSGCRDDSKTGRWESRARKQEGYARKLEFIRETAGTLQKCTDERESFHTSSVGLAGVDSGIEHGAV